jgi:RNA polymerase sigma factor (sigma-70 family)
MPGSKRAAWRRLGAQATLNPTAFVREVDLDLRKRDDPPAIGDFCAYAARAMRNLLIDAARRRGGSLHRTGLDAVDDAGIGRGAEHALELDAALRELAEADSHRAEVVVLHHVAGLPLERIAELPGVSLRTIDRDRPFARARLREQWMP